MQSVQELMVPVDSYVTVPDGTTVGEAIRILEKVRHKYQSEGKEYKPRQLIVLDSQNRVVGMLSQRDVVVALEPKYKTEQGDEAIAHTSQAGLSPELLKSMMKWYSLWGESFDARCQKVIRMTVKECMHIPRRDEYITENEQLEAAIHQMVMGGSRSLLVTRGDNVVGILRLSDVFEQVSRAARKA